MRDFDDLIRKLRAFGVTSPTNLQERRVLYRMACSVAVWERRHGSGLFVDLGSYGGATAMVIAQALIDESSVSRKVVTVDDYRNPDWTYKQVIENIEKCGFSENVQVIGMEDLAYLSSLDEASISFSYSDTWHAYNHVRQLLPLVLSKTRTGGLICGHDYCPGERGVVQAVDEFFAENPLLMGRGLHDRIWWTIKDGGGQIARPPIGV